MSKSKYLIELGNKVSDKQIDQIINDFYFAFKNDAEKQNNYEFDFSNLKWISNQELLILTGLFQYLIETDTRFKINFLINGSSSDIDKKIANQIVQIWDVWKIYQIVPHQDYNKYFDIDGNFVKRIRKQFNISSSNQEIYDRYGVTPFLSLPRIQKYDDKAVSKLLNKIYSLSEATNQILVNNNCYLPFENKTLSSIITKELYENFLDHFTSSFFKSQKNAAFLSISLKRKLNEEYFDKKKVQSLLELNFKEENIEELKPFFFNKFKNEFKNESLLQMSFLDYGEGISKTLFNSFSNEINEISESQHLDSNVLKYAFEPLSSQHKVQERFNDNIITPRGLFDVIAIVKRFDGLVVVRSNNGKIAFDFSDNKSIKEAFIFFGNEKLYFPGSLISIYIPERQLKKKFDSTSIKPSVNFDNFNFQKKNKKTLRLFDIQKQLKSSSPTKNKLYNDLFELLLSRMKLGNNDSLIYLDFQGYEIDERIAKKIIYFICSDYRFNYQNNIIVLNPPPKQFLKNIKDEISELEEVDKKFRFHPTPFVYLDELKNELEIFWLGVYSEKDIQKLNDLLFEEHDLRASDFENPDDIIGHINKYDKLGNLYSAIDSKEIFNYYKIKKDASINEEIKGLVVSCIQKEEGSIYLCNGNYYQYEYFLMNEVLYNEDKLNYLSNNLFLKIQDRLKNLEDVLFAGITSSSHKILESLISQGHLKKENYVQLDNYFSFEKEKAFSKLTIPGSKVVLICDVISTGFLVNKFESHLKETDSELIGIGVLINAIDKSYLGTDYSGIEKILIPTINYKLEKKHRSEISNKLNKKELKVIRINPYTNTPISHSIKETNSNEAILMDNQDFINLIDSSQIKIGYFEFNNLIHPYFFDMDVILDKSSPTSNKILSELIQKLEKKKTVKDIDFIFYPNESGIKNIDFEYFKNNIIPKHSIEFIKLERFATNEGWRFSHPPKSLMEKSKDKNALILDDGSCSGESLLQMIDEVAFLDVQEITVLSIVGRVNEHKREFFSRLKSIQAGSKTIKISIYFGCHWHLPTYHLSKSPVIDEITRLKILSNFPNTPKGIRKIAENVLSELRLKETKEDNNKYLVKDKKGKEIIKELILTRDHFGKISEFRFYKEYFNYFNDFIAEYESQSRKARGNFPYKKIELISAAIIHEPYLFDSIKKVLPDLVEKIEDFLETLLLKENRIKIEDLTFKWDIKNIYHLLFIVYKNEALFNKLTVRNVSVIISDFSPNNIDYLLYKLTSYLKIDSFLSSSNEDYSGKVKVLINSLIEEKDLNETVLKSLKRYRPFLYSLKSNDNFDSKLSKVKHNFDKIINDQYHKDCITAHFDSFHVKLMELEVEPNENSINDLINLWDKIVPFISDILDLSISYSHFFISFGGNLLSSLETEENSLRKLFGRLNDLIYEANENTDFSSIRKSSTQIYSKYVKSESKLYRVFSKLITSDIGSVFEEFISELSSEIKFEIIGKELIEKKSICIDVPYLIIKEIIFDELKSNFRHADINSPIYITWEESCNSDFVCLKIKNKNKSSTAEISGGGSGIDLFKSFSNYPNKNLEFDSYIESGYFIQKFKFKLK
ncbi:hypothetical protein BC962_0845 [Gillisia mitskevichiae]|uniref:Phosphoribosyltransferase domain-containing protein n=1 Tax=Gillisia mitskevichiae TaxID=270921 RepID=A0A495PZC6_9FLAO|nr:hypothetical protein [Gillisia mitskevichiae]RKS55872.1 hypothetical protein BC962_0845 [Gillisia mitskevichiae]